ETKQLQRITISTLIVSVLSSLLLYLFSTQALAIFGGITMLKYGFVLDLILILIPIVSLTIVVGNCFLVAKGHYKEYNWSLIISAILFVLLLTILNLTDNLNFINVIIVRILADFIQLIIRLYFNFKYRII
ncbi:MAG TPA: hypothetical protein VIH02_00465, partial [Flavobacterium sp.]